MQQPGARQRAVSRQAYMGWRFLAGIVAVITLTFGGFYAWAWLSKMAPAGMPLTTDRIKAAIGV